MRAILIAQALLTAAAAEAQETSALAPDPGGIDPDQISAAADSVARRELPRPWNEKDVFDGDYAIVGAGIAAIPSYEGSNNLRAIPAAGAIGRVAGIGFRIRGPSLSTDFVADKPGSRIGIRFGPLVRWRGNRSGSLGDPVVARLPRLKSVIEGGVGLGVDFKRVLSKQDSLSVGVSARWDLSGRGSGRIVSPSVNYLLPMSKAQVVGVQLSADFIDRKYARYNYSISPAGSAASGLPAYRAHGGFKEASVGAFTARDLNGNFLDGGFAVGAGAMYSRLYGSAARTPITAQRGSRAQWLLGAGVSYTF